MPPGVCDLERETDGEDRGYWPTRDAYLRGRRLLRADMANAVGDLSGQDTHYATLIKASPEFDSVVRQNL
ncbi:hypothetical protein B0H14DRAFT_3462691 [Mycena olivaceomarginata]|nr:hypothetical protein B0H14DRAFT_3462691 [Mycena olivaceomarginata]